MDSKTCSGLSQGVSCVAPKLLPCDPAAVVTSLAKGARPKVHVGSDPPPVGAWIYTPTRGSFSHGHDDVAGGLAQVTKVVPNDCNGGDHWIHVAQHGRSFSWKHIRVEQDALRIAHGDTFAHADPDYHDYGPDSGWSSGPVRSPADGRWRSLF